MDGSNAEPAAHQHAAQPRRVNYHSGVVLGAAEFIADQTYFREKSKRHNRYLHGSGVVAGLEVSAAGGKVRVTPGLALDCEGNEIVLAAALVADPPGGEASVYVGIRYAERETDPVPVPDPTDGLTAYARVEEIAQLTYETINPFGSHRRAGKSCRACGAAHAVPLARLKLVDGRWRLDRRFRPPRVKR